MKQIASKRLALLGILVSTIFFSYAYAADTTFDTFVTQISSWLWSNNSEISTELYPRPSGSGAYYINKWNNSSIIWNYFEGYYYDSVLWYFQFDWSVNQSENVRVVGSTSECSDSYWYKLGGYSYSPSFWYVDFDYDEDIYVYYCEDEGFLRWYAYNSFTWFQNFTWITFDIGTTSDIVSDPPEWDDTFVNSSTDVLSDTTAWDAIDPWNSEQINSNFTRNTIQNDKFEFDARVESSFYIIK